MIPEDVKVKLIGTTKKQRETVVNILIGHSGKRMINDFIKNAAYASTFGYWKKPHIPISGTMMTAKDFLAKYGEKKDTVGYTQTKQEGLLYKALQTLLHHSVDKTGRPKKATVKQLRAAGQALTNFDKHSKAICREKK